MKYYNFKTRVFKKSGFYALRYSTCEEFAYCDKPKYHHTNVFSFFAITENNRNNTPLDLGIYLWTNYRDYGPIEWRRLNKKEIEQLQSNLYKFNRKKS